MFCVNKEVFDLSEKYAALSQEYYTWAEKYFSSQSYMKASYKVKHRLDDKDTRYSARIDSIIKKIWSAGRLKTSSIADWDYEIIVLPYTHLDPSYTKKMVSIDLQTTIKTSKLGKKEKKTLGGYNYLVVRIYIDVMQTVTKRQIRKHGKIIRD